MAKLLPKSRTFETWDEGLIQLLVPYYPNPGMFGRDLYAESAAYKRFKVQSWMFNV